MPALFLLVSLEKSKSTSVCNFLNVHRIFARLLLAVTVWDQNETVTTGHDFYYCFPTFPISWGWSFEWHTPVSWKDPDKMVFELESLNVLLLWRWLSREAVERHICLHKYGKWLTMPQSLIPCFYEMHLNCRCFVMDSRQVSLLPPCDNKLIKRSVPEN